MEPAFKPRGEDKAGHPSAPADVRQPKSNRDSLNISDLFNCYICFGKVRNPVMCPQCSKLCCEQCIKKWIIEQRSQCPHCRAPLRLTQLVNCRFINDITAVLRAFESLKKETAKDEKCPVHHQSLMYFCATCQKSVCSDCAMFGSDHRDHKFEHLDKVYENHVQSIREAQTYIRQRLSGYLHNMDDIRQTLNELQKAKEDKMDESAKIFHEIKERLEFHLKTKQMTLLAQKNIINDEIGFLEGLEENVNKEIDSASKSALVERSTELVKSISEVKDRPAVAFDNSVVTTDLPYRAATDDEFVCGTFELPHYSQNRTSGNNYFLSAPLVINGLVWRLKVYPNGNGATKGTFLAVFFHMEEGLPEPSKYEYKVELTNHRNPQLSVIRVSISEFVSNDCWGYNKFFKIEDLYNEGYLTPEDERLVIKFYVRAPLYCQHAKDQRRYINQLEGKVKTLEEKLTRYEKLCVEKGLVPEPSKPAEEAKSHPAVEAPSRADRTNLNSDSENEEPDEDKKSPLVEAMVEVPVEHCDTHDEEGKNVSLEDMIKNIEIGPRTESEGEEEGEVPEFEEKHDEEDVESNEEDQPNGEEEEEVKIAPKPQQQEPAAVPKPEANMAADVEAAADDEVLKEISNRYEGNTKSGKKVMISMVRSRANNGSEAGSCPEEGHSLPGEDGVGFVVMKKGSVSARGSPQAEGRKKLDLSDVQQSATVIESESSVPKTDPNNA